MQISKKKRKKKKRIWYNYCTVFPTWFMKSELFFEEHSVGTCILNGTFCLNFDLNNFSCPHWPHITATTPALHPATCTRYYGHCSDGEPASPSWGSRHHTASCIHRHSRATQLPTPEPAACAVHDHTCCGGCPLFSGKLFTFYKHLLAMKENWTVILHILFTIGCEISLSKAGLLNF